MKEQPFEGIQRLQLRPGLPPEGRRATSTVIKLRYALYFKALGLPNGPGEGYFRYNRDMSNLSIGSAMKSPVQLGREKIDGMIITCLALVLLFGAAIAAQVAISRYWLIGFLVLFAVAILYLARIRKRAHKIYKRFTGPSRVWAALLVVLFAFACVYYVAGAIAIAKGVSSNLAISRVIWAGAAFVACGALMSLPLGRKQAGAPIAPHD